MTDNELPKSNNEPPVANDTLPPLAPPAANNPSAAQSPPQNNIQPPMQNKAERRLWPAGLAIFSAILALITAWGGYQLWIELNQARSGYLRSVENNRAQFSQLQSDLDSKLRTQLDGAANQIKIEIANAQQQVRGEADQKISGMQQSIAEVEGGFVELRNQLIERIEVVEQSQSGQQAMIQQAQMELRQAISNHRLNWAMSEIGYLTSIASEKIQFEQDVEGALTALTQALQRLREFNEPSLTNLRDALQQDITVLAESPRANIREAVVKLTELVKQSSHLATSRKIVISNSENNNSTLPAQENSSSGDIWHKTWEWLSTAANSAWVEIKNLVVIRHNQEVQPPLLPPDQAFFLVQNLRLQLESARLAVLRQDDDVYRSILEETKGWITRYFDLQAEPVKQFLSDINNLIEQDLTPAIPELRSSKILVQSQQMSNLNGPIPLVETPSGSDTPTPEDAEKQTP